MTDDTSTTQETSPEAVRSAWWNPWHWPAGVWALVIGTVLLAAPFGIRAFFLLQVPEIPEPFDVEEYSRWDVPADQDAFTEYRRASDLQAQLAAVMPDDDILAAVQEQGWSAADDSIRQYLELHREALTIWRRGTAKDRGLNLSPLTINYKTELKVVQAQRTFVRLALLESARLIHEGNLDEAWRWSRAAYRCGGHTSHRGCMLQGLVASAIHTTSTLGIARWAEQPGVTADQLKRALAAVIADSALYESESNLLKGEYLGARNTLRDPDWDRTLGVGGVGYDDAGIIRSVQKMGYWTLGEPELTVRIFRQALANQIQEVDRPAALRSPLAGAGTYLLFMPDPAVAMHAGQLDPLRIDRTIQSSFLARQVLPAMRQFDSAILRQRARQVALEVLLAAQAWRRDHGEFPDPLSRLVPDYLPSVPADPSDPAGGPVSYRRDEPLKGAVWGFGGDKVDSGGDVVAKNRQPNDAGFELQP